jgi:hypothetical protein
MKTCAIVICADHYCHMSSIFPRKTGRISVPITIYVLYHICLNQSQNL